MSYMKGAHSLNRMNGERNESVHRNSGMSIKGAGMIVEW